VPGNHFPGLLLNQNLVNLGDGLMDGSNRWPETEPFGFTSKKGEMAGNSTPQQFLIQKCINALLMRFPLVYIHPCRERRDVKV